MTGYGSCFFVWVPKVLGVAATDGLLYPNAGRTGKSAGNL